jgi:hypothetical protein
MALDAAACRFFAHFLCTYLLYFGPPLLVLHPNLGSHHTVCSRTLMRTSENVIQVNASWPSLLPSNGTDRCLNPMRERGPVVPRGHKRCSRHEPSNYSDLVVSTMVRMACFNLTGLFLAFGIFRTLGHRNQIVSDAV